MSVTIAEAQARLGQLIASLKPGESVEILQDAQPVARLVKSAPAAKQPRVPGSAIGKLVIHAEDEGHLDQFQEHMP